MPMNDRTREMIARAKELRAEKPYGHVRRLMAEFGISVGYAEKLSRAARDGCCRHAQRMSAEQSGRRGRRAAEKAAPRAPGGVAMLDRVAELRPLAASQPRRVSIAYVAARFVVSPGYACRLRQMAEQSPDDAAATHERQTEQTRQWLAGQGPEYMLRRAEQQRAWVAANPERVKEIRRRCRKAAGPARVVRERGAVAVADALHQRLASMLPAGMPTVIADEIVAAAWLAATEGAGLDEAIAIGRRSARGIMEFEFASLDAPIAGDSTRRLVDLIDDGSADDEDSILARLDREREWRRAS